MAAIARAGLNSLYTLRKTAGLQPGSLSKVIKRLIEAGLLVRSEGTKRGRRTMTLTAEGYRFLEQNWAQSLDSSREMESILRGATVALSMGAPEPAVHFLLRSASERDRRTAGQQSQSFSSESSPMDVLAAIRAEYEGRRRKMEAGLLREFGERLRMSFMGHEIK